MRLIDADALLTERKKSKYYHLPNGDIAIPIIDVEHAPTVKSKPQWIPVSERLPKVRQWVLCQCRAGIIDVLRLTDDGCWYRKSNEIYMSGFVLAWMPLPEPYREERTEE